MTNVVQPLSIAYQATEEQVRRCRLIVCQEAEDAAEALLIMEMLNILPG